MSHPFQGTEVWPHSADIPLEKQELVAQKQQELVAKKQQELVAKKQQELVAKKQQELEQQEALQNRRNVKELKLPSLQLENPSISAGVSVFIK